MKANSDKSKQSNKATRRVLAGVLCGASVLSLVLSLVMPPISQAIANDAEAGAAEETVAAADSSSESTDVENTNNGDTENQNSDDAEGGEGEDAAAAGLPSDDTKVEGDTQPSDAQPADDENNDENAPATVSADDYTKVNGDVAKAFTNGGKFQLTGPAHSNQQIAIDKATTIDLNGNMLYNDAGVYNDAGAPDSFFVVKKGATLTIEDSGKTSGKTIDEQSRVETTAGQPAIMTWEGGNGSSSNGVAPKSLTYYETTSAPKQDGLGTTETTTKHVVSGFGAIVAASHSGSVKQVISVADGGTLNLNGGMITTPGDLAGDGHIILAVGNSNETQVNINGGFITGANLNQQRGGWGGGLCVVGAEVTVNMTGGVIAANEAASGGGIYAENAKLNLSGGVISGNATYSDSDGLGGGILVSGGSVTVSGGYITNNKYAKFCGHDGWGCHGGAGLAANKGAHVTISGGKITGNYSEEAGGGVYVTNQKQQGMAWLKITGGIIASNVSHRSEGAGIRVGQQVDAMINGTPNSKVYITHNRCMSRFDWGGGGIFVQGNSIEGQEKTAGRLFVYNSYISSNTAGGYGGGVAVCPTGKTLVTNTKGTAIFGNLSAGAEQEFKEYNRADGTGNDGTPHLSAGGAEGTNKTEDQEAYNSEDFRKYGHADFFLAATGHTTPVAVVSGKMLGDIDAKYSGSIELKGPITIPANGVAQVKNSIGLISGVSAKDKAVAEAVQNDRVTTFITDNYSWNHGGGIMSNGDLYLGEPADTYVYPSLKLKATKVLTGRDLKDKEFTFTVYRKASDTAKAPYWKNDEFDKGGCEFVESVPNNADGNIAFDLSEDVRKQLLNNEDVRKQFLANGAAEITYYLVEDAGKLPGVIYDRAVYEIKVTVKYTSTVLMSVPIQGKTDEFKNLNVYSYTIDRVDVTKNPGGSASSPRTVSVDANGYYSIVDSSSATSTNKATFTNKYDPEVSWTPEATKVVEGGEMKEFTLQLATDRDFNHIIGTAVTAGNDKGQTLSFKDVTDKNKTVELKYSLSDIRNNPDPGDSTGGPSKTFTYYVCEKNEGSTYPHYKFDQSVYKLTVVAKDDDAGITTKVTYTQIKDADGKPIDEAAPVEYNDGSDTTKPKSIPTFTNTYSTSLPLSGMSGVTLTYLAGAAVLCAAAAWMHIRRKANAKGGERRE